jgi:hypothetical protein
MKKEHEIDENLLDKELHWKRGHKNINNRKEDLDFSCEIFDC